jgi:glycosyltransferase involved in cell wall biosynthesis
VLEEIRTKLALRAGIGVGETPDARQMGILRGFLDEANCEMVSGWAWQPEHPDTPVRLDILADGTIVGEIVANDLRPDVREAGFGDGRSGFRLRWPTPLSPFVPHVIEARRTSDKAELGHSGQIIGATQRLNDETLRVFAAALSATAAAEDEAGRATLRRFMQGQTDQLLTTCARSSAARDVARDTSKLALFIDQTLPTPDCDSASQAVLDHMRALRQLGYRVAFASGSGSATTTDDDRTALEAAGIICYLPPAIGSVEEALRRLGPDLALVYLHRVGTASLYSQLVRHYCPEAMLVFSVAELHFVRVARQAALAGRAGLMGESRRLRDRELLAVAMADRVITHSPAEAALLRAEAPHAKVHVVPWSFPTRPRTAPFQQRRGIAFIGGYRHSPNVDAAHWLVEVIMPLVWQQDPDIECFLVGSHMPDELRRINRPGIVPMGYVPDLGTVFDRVRLTIAPLRYGAGIKGKVLQSLAAGLPCICTSLAAEGLPILLQNCIGDTAADLASLCLRLHGDEGHNAAIAATGLQLVLDQYSTERVDQLMAVAVGREITPIVFDASAA